MTVRVYRSTDASAPVLTGSVGSLVALFDACLVNGYGTQTAAGWTKPYAATNKGAYLQNLTGSNNTAGMYLYVDDTGPGAGGAREARVTGFETMSAITPTGTGQFPTLSQAAIGIGALVIRKSTTADATARPWTLVANGQTIYLWTETGDQVWPTGAFTFCFGDFKSYKPNDQYAVMIMSRQIENSNAAQYEAFPICAGGSNTYTLSNIVAFGHYIARHWSGVGGSIKCGKTWDYSRAGLFASTGGQWGGDTSGQAANSGLTFGRNNTAYGCPSPMPIDGSIQLSPVYLNHSNSLRGYLPGIWAPLHDRPLGHNDTFTITSGLLNGKTMLAQFFFAYISNTYDSGTICVETSSTWS